ncbi:hypothetical protein CLOM_g12228, partial [Closterium sp. NIES-68]
LTDHQAAAPSRVSARGAARFGVAAAAAAAASPAAAAVAAAAAAGSGGSDVFRCCSGCGGISSPRPSTTSSSSASTRPAKRPSGAREGPVHGLRGHPAGPRGATVGLNIGRVEAHKAKLIFWTWAARGCLSGMLGC